MLQRIMWTALPAGRVDGGLRVSVAVGPLLDPQQDPQVLATFPDLLTWPATSIGWRVAIGDAEPVDATPISEPDPQLWSELFSADTLVRPPEHPDYTEHLWWSYPVGHVVDFVQGLYQEVATGSPLDHPDVDTLLEPGLGLRPLAHLDDDGTDRRRELIRLLEEEVRQAKALPPGPADPETDLLQVLRFHRAAPLGERPEPPTFDFHQAVALCSEHPGLARRLGLVHDLFVPEDPAAAFPQGEPITVRVEPVWEPTVASSTDVLPATVCRIGTDAFLAEPQDPTEIVRGRLPLDTGPYRIVQVDPDGAALGILQFARNLVLARLRSSDDTPTSEALPALASAGFSVARTGHAPQMRQTVQTGRTLHAARESEASILLHAEDVTRGYRFDVWTSLTGQWQSLQHRIGDYQVASTSVEIDEEGFVIEVPTDRGETEEPGLYLQESLFRWDGWSLAAPRPGRTLLQDDVVADAPGTPSDGFPLTMHFRARPGSLPRLRFGESYRFRARTVDIAGNSVDIDAEDVGASDPRPYLRFEPVAAPVTLLQAPRTEGETVDRVVLRSNFDADPDPETPQRHIAPPAVTQRTAEEHGLYDTEAGVDPAAYADIVAREAKTFDDVGTIDAAQWPEAFRLPYFPQVPLVVPYLPDPMARGVSLRGLPGAGDQVVLSGFDHDLGWPRSRPLRLVVEAGDGPPQLTVTAEERVLTVKLPKAEIATVRMSSHLASDDLALSGIWRWMITKPGVTDGQIDQWRSQAVRGLLWMITPYRVLTLVHAVRQPLATPEFTDLAAVRQRGDTFADLDDSITFHRRSTSRVDLHATWTEPVDDGAGGGTPAADPFDREHQQVLRVPEREGGVETDALTFILRQEFGDTKHRRVTYEAEATSAFTEYFVVRAQVQLSGEDIVVLPGAEQGIVEDSEVVRLEATTYQRDVHYTMAYADAQLTRLPVPVDEGGIPDGAMVDVEYLPAPVTRTSQEAATLDIPSSARPPSPTCLYVIPTHEWSRGVGVNDIASVGKGGGLRVYLDRPLLQSGEGELLGVLLDPNPDDPSAVLAPYVTRWGFDPVRGGPNLPQAAPTATNFPLRVPTDGSGLLLEEIDATVAVAGHEVAFDTERGLWYCDLEVDAGEAYWPFIRLALASYQPTSLAGVHLSGVVLADFVQLTPDRSATLVFAPTGRSVEVSVLGVGPLAGIEMTATVERKDGAIDDDALGWEPVTGQRPTVLQGQVDRSGATRWSGTVSLPSSRGRRAGPVRIVIEEFGVETDGGAGATARGSMRGPGAAARQPARQLRYRDIIPLDR
jgi:hypothetical protein